MNATKKELVERQIIITLLIVFALSIVYSKRKENKGAAGSAKFEAANIKPEMLSGNSIEKAIKGMERYDGESVRNPFAKPKELFAQKTQESQAPMMAPAPIKDEKKDSFTLEGVILSGKENLAIVSGTVIGQGEYINGAKVVSITRDGVVLSKDGSQIELKR